MEHFNPNEEHNEYQTPDTGPTPQDNVDEILRLWEDPAVTTVQGSHNIDFRFALVAQIYAHRRFDTAYDADSTMDETHPLWQAVAEADRRVNAFTYDAPTDRTQHE